jgi:hypothetical protein
VNRTQLAQIAAEATDAPLLLVSVSGAHLYGFDSPDSDIDLRGTHLLSLQPAPEYGLAHLADLIAMKVKEKATARLPVEEHDAALQALQEQLTLAYERSPLPAEPANRAALNDFLVRVRLAGGRDHGMA